jgi:hypothetical protein
LDVDDQATSLVDWAVMVTSDVTDYSSCLGVENVPPSLACEAVMVTLDRMGSSIIGGGSLLLVDGT